MPVDVLQSRKSFILQTSVRLSMNYTFLTTEWNGAKLEFENFTYTKKRKNENTQITTWRSTDRRCKGTGNTIEGSFEFLLTNPHYHVANLAKKELVQIEKAIESRAVQSLEPPRVVVQMSTNNSTGEAVAQMPNQRTMVRRIQRRRIVAHIPNPLNRVFLNPMVFEKNERIFDFLSWRLLAASLISFSYVQNRQLKLGAAGYLSRSTWKVT